MNDNSVVKFNKGDIEVILQNSIYQPGNNYNVNWPFDVIEKSISVEFVNPQVNSLRKLFVQLSPSDKKQFISELLSFLEFHKDITIPQTAFSTLIHISSFNQAFREVAKNFGDYRIQIFNAQMCITLAEILKNEWGIFTRDQIDYLYDFTKDTLEFRNVLGKKISETRNLYGFFMSQLEILHRKLNIIKMFDLQEQIFVGTSYEITTDEKALENEFKKFNFPDDLTETLNKIDLNISMAKDNFDFKGVIDLIRSFTERLFLHIAITLDEKEGKGLDEKDSEKVAAFFVEKQLISDDQGKLLIALRHFLSNEGVHRLKSRPDDARLSRNMIVELSLYLILRLNDLKEQTPTPK